jgi:hypothetical protein
MDWVSFAAGCGFTVCICSALASIAILAACRSVCDFDQFESPSDRQSIRDIEMNERLIPDPFDGDEYF